MQLKKWGLMIPVLFGFSVSASAAEVTISCGAVGQEMFLCKQETQAWAEKTGHTVHIVRAPETTDQRYDEYVELLKRSDPMIDVYQIDVIWPGLLGEYFVDLKKYIPEEDIEHDVPAPGHVENRVLAEFDRFRGRMVLEHLAGGRPAPVGTRRHGSARVRRARVVITSRVPSNVVQRPCSGWQNRIRAAAVFPAHPGRCGMLPTRHPAAGRASAR